MCIRDRIKAVPDSTNKMVVNGKDGYAMKPVSILKAELGEKPDTSMGWGLSLIHISTKFPLLQACSLGMT